MRTAHRIRKQKEALLEFDLDPEQSEWDGYIAAQKDSVFSHLHGWAEIIAGTYSLPLFRLVTRKRDTGKITGALPLILFSPPDADKRLISLPYTDAAGIVADNETAFTRLLNEALKLSAGFDAVHLELRQGGVQFAASIPALAKEIDHVPHAFKVGLSRPLPTTTETLWAGLGPKVRNQVRKARRSGCCAVVGETELVDEFFDVFSENMRDLGSPVHARSLFQLLCERLGAKIIVVRIDRIPAAAAMVFYHNGTLFNPWASSIRRFRPLCPNMLLYWTMLAHAVDAGCHHFDFGRSSPGTPTCRFKRQWGAVVQPLTWHVFSRKPYCWNPGNENLTDSAWKSMDLQASRLKGPTFRRWISL